MTASSSKADKSNFYNFIDRTKQIKQYGLQEFQHDSSSLLWQDECGQPDQFSAETRLRAHVHRPSHIGLLRSWRGFQPSRFFIHIRQPARFLGAFHSYARHGLGASFTPDEDVHCRMLRSLLPFLGNHGGVARSDFHRL